MEILKNLYLKSPNTSSINLEFSELDDISPLLPVLSRFSYLSELILFGNRIEALPRDLSVLMSLKKLDISNNLFPSISAVLPGLKSLQNLRELNITFSTQSEEDQLISALPRLNKLNDMPLSPDSPLNESGESLSQDDLEKIAMMYDDIRNYAKDIDRSLDKKLASDFDELIKEIMKQLSEVLQKETNSFLTQSHMILAKFNMYRICQEKVAFLAGKTNAKLAKIIHDLAETNKGIFEQICKVMFGSFERLKKEESSQHLSRSNSQMVGVAKKIEFLEKEIEKLRIDQKEKNLAFLEEKQEFLKEIEALQEENKKYLDTIVKHSKANTGSAQNKGIEDKEKFQNTGTVNSTLIEDKTKIQLLTSRVLSLKQLKDTISEIYESKSKFDEKCAEGKMPRETMEQHMYTFLNQKYGLRSLVIEWVASIITGIKSFSAEDNDVVVFAKILRNECDEEFRFVQTQVKETVAELLRVQIKNKFPLKSASDLNKILEEKTSAALFEDEWVEIVKYMYNQTDSQVILNQINLIIFQKNSSANSRSRAREEKKISSIPYSAFLKLLLDFQLKAHEKFLRPFVRVFRSVVSRSGVLTEADFLVLCKQLFLAEEVRVKLLSRIDPFENDAITFSECVALFSAEILPFKNVSILQDLSLR